MSPTDEKYFSIFNEASDSILILDDDGRLTDANSSICKLLGYTRQELLNMNIEGLVDSGQLQNDPIAYELMMNGKHILRERRLQKKDGSIVEMEINVKRVAKNLIVAMGRDITEINNAQRTNALSESKFRSAFENSAMGMLLVSTEGKLLQVNKQFANITGYTQKELLQMTFYDVTHPDDIEKGLSFANDALQGKISTYTFEKRYIHKNKEAIWVNLTSSVVKDETNKPLYFVAQIEDITAKKESELKFKNLLEKSLVGIYIHQDGHFKYVNPRMTEIFGFNEEEFLKIPLSLVIHEDDLHISLEKVRQRIEGEEDSIHYQVRGKRKDGTTIWLEIFGSTIIHLGKKAIIGNMQDITDRKNAETAVKEQGEMFKAIIENTKESIYLISPEYKIIQFNNTALERMRECRGMELSIGEDFRPYLFPENAHFFYSMFKDSLKGEYRVQEMRSKGVTGEYYWSKSQTSPVYDREGKFIGTRLLTESINDRKQAEAELRESEDKFRSIVEQSLVGIFIIQNGKLAYVNPGFEKIFGYSKNEMVNKMSFDGFVHADDIEMVQANYRDKIHHGMAKQQYTFRVNRKDGAVLHVEVISTLIMFNGQPAIIGTLVDITDRVEEEERINKAVFDAQEQERLQIGMELHDNVKQILAGSGLFLDFARKNIDNKEKVAEILDNLIKYNAEAIHELRRLSHQLAPAIEMNSNLEEKITWLIKSLKIDEKLSVSLNIDKFEKPLDSNIQLNLYRILQEQLANVLKYACASAVEINIRSLKEVVRLQVKDNGKGFDINSAKKGIGLENIQRRAQLLNGYAEISSSPGKGSEVKVVIPLGSCIK